MASPFTTFRKNQKILMAIFGIALMFLFVIQLGSTDLITVFFGNPRQARGNDPAVITWKYGSIRESEMQQLRIARVRLRQFFDLVAREAFSRDNNYNPKVGGVPNTDAEESIVETLVLAKEAERVGLVVTDAAINEYLLLFADNLLNSDQIEAMRRTHLSEHITRHNFYDALRRELAAQKMRQIGQGGLIGASGPAITPPGPAWEYYERLHRRITAELVPFSVEDYLSAVKQEPTAAQVEKLYEDRKDHFPEPLSAEPGFRRRRQVAFQYVVVDYNKMLEVEKAKVADAEVADYYEKNKNNFRVPELPEADPTKTLDLEKFGTPKDEPKDGEPKQEEPQPDATPPAPTESAPDKTPPATPENPGNQPADADKANDANKKVEPSSSQEDPKDQTLDLNPPSAPCGDPADEKPQSADGASEDVKPAAELGPKTEPVKDETPPKEPSAGDKPEAAGTDQPAEKKPEFKPLADVADEIRTAIALPKAEDRKRELLLEVRRAIEEYQGNLAAWKAKLIDQEPSPPDVKQLVASVPGASVGEIPLVDEITIARDYPIGKSFELSSDPTSMQRSRRVPFAEIGFIPGLALYKPFTTTGADREEYLVWKTEEQADFVPKLADIRDEVVRAWKLVEARKLAMEDTQKALAEAKQSGGSLADKFIGKKKVVETGPISYYDEFGVLMFRFQGQPFGLSEIPGVEGVGDDFMRGLFGLRVGELGAVFNQPQTFVYLARIRSETPGKDAAREEFLNELVSDQVGGRLPMELMAVAYRDDLDLLRSWYQEIEKQMDVKWQRDPARSGDF